MRPLRRARPLPSLSLTVVLAAAAGGVAAPLGGCADPVQEESTLRLDLSGCLAPQLAAGVGCGDSLRERFGVAGVPACLAVSGPGGTAAIPMRVAAGDGSLRPDSATAPSLPLTGAREEVAFKLYIMADSSTAGCTTGTFRAEGACDFDACLLATPTVRAEVGGEGVTEVRFGTAEQACEFECNDPCAPGDAACVSVCQPLSGEAVEACDGRDNDCDTVVDEGCDADGDGFCAVGALVVGDGGPCPAEPRDCDDADPTVKPGAGEQCDAVDNDCDGRINEPDDMSGAQLCPRQSGVCAGTSALCSDGEWIECDARVFGTLYDGAFEERCDDGLDNDCDGTVDDGDGDCLCDGEGETRRCSVTLGACVAGTQRCVLDGEQLVWDACDGVHRTDETCNGVDDDCDGRTDEGLAQDPQTCAGGAPCACREGAWVCDATGTEEVEVTCDGIDNDCDGLVDEPDALVAPENARCPDRGVCAGLAAVCADGGQWRCDYPASYEADEVSCDGLDNDCDGLVDEDPLPAPAEGPCAGEGVCADARPRCADGQWACELPGTHEPDDEVTCDGLDNDCDGEVDEAPDGGPLASPCYEGAAETEGVGLCRPGVYVCRNGRYDQSECLDQVVPADEDCDGLDNDCDGDTDEADDGGAIERPCYDGPDGTRGVGICGDGRQECAGGQWSEGCEGATVPGEETCDGADEDCDGDVDELVSISCGVGRCRNEAPACVGGVPSDECEPRLDLMRDETCNAVDDDCDELVDELDPIACGEGVCRSEVPACVDGRDNRSCRPVEENATDELCDGLDNDCDGEVDENDEGLPLVGPCYGGPEGTEGVGLCAAGVATCDQPDPECVGEVLPAAEECNGLDDSCDGEVDGSPLTAGVAPPGGAVTLAGGHRFGAGDLTIEAWVRLDDGAAPEEGVVLDQPGAGRLVLLVATDQATVAAVRLDDGEQQTEATGATPIPGGAWTHLAAVRDGSSLRLFVGGALDAEAALPAPAALDPDGSDLFVGRRFEPRAGSADVFPGRVDEVRISRGARYRGAFVPPERLVLDGTTARLWHLDEGEGAAADAAGGGALSVAAGAWTDQGLPVRTLIYRDGDGDGVGVTGDSMRACAAPEGWAALAGDCDDEDGGVGAPVPEVLGNAVDDDCDGRTDDEDGLRAVSLTGGAYFTASVGHAFHLRGTSWTWDAWVRVEAWSETSLAPIVSNRDTGDGAGYLLAIGGLAGGEAARRPLLLLDTGLDEVEVISDREVALGRWFHLAVTYDEGTTVVTVYVDGQPAASQATAAMPFGRTTLSIGRDAPDIAQETDLALDDLRVSPVVRWAEAFEPPPCATEDPDTKALWRFEEVGEEGGPEPDAESVGTDPARRAVPRSGAVRVDGACEDRAPPAADCLAWFPDAVDVCRDGLGSCALGAALAGGTCADWCADAGAACLAANVRSGVCGVGAALNEGCDTVAAEAICTCERP